jgi:hypothetical protein
VGDFTKSLTGGCAIDIVAINKKAARKNLENFIICFKFIDLKKPTAV